MRQEHITSRQNPLLVHIRKLQASRSYRKASGEFAAEGTKLLEEAAKWYPGLHTVVCREGLKLCKLPEQVRIVTVPEDVFKSISTVDTPQGAIFLCRLPERQQADLTAGTLLLDGIQDPGNLGTMLRTADALGVPIALLDGCADPYSFKTVRASMGAVFRMDIPAITEAEVLAQCAEKNLMLTVTALNDRAVDIRGADFRNAVAVIGSEGQGVRQSLLEAAAQSVIIPMQAHCESLNAAIAAAIVMWQMKNGEYGG
jgi:TrmH family RNA methyltransferase